MTELSQAAMALMLAEAALAVLIQQDSFDLHQFGKETVYRMKRVMDKASWMDDATNLTFEDLLEGIEKLQQQVER